MWTIFITGSRWGKFAVDIVTSCWMIYFSDSYFTLNGSCVRQ